VCVAAHERLEIETSKFVLQLTPKLVEENLERHGTTTRQNPSTAWTPKRRYLSLGGLLERILRTLKKKERVLFRTTA
jgi:hypothetical protein